MGNKISKTIDGLTTNYVMDGNNIIEETKNVTTEKYTYNDRWI